MQSPHFAAVRKLRFPGRHLFVLVHGYQGNSWDMRLLRNVLAVFHPEARFHCSTVNEGLTEGDIDAMGRRLADEVDAQVSEAGGGVGGDHDVTRISFIGHSLGGLIIRAALTAPAMSAHLAKLHTLVTLASPFCGYLFNQSRLLTSGLYVMQRMFGSSCLLQLSLQDHTDPRETFVYRLAHQPGLQLFRNVVLLSSPEDQV
jgi:pimeloyl-ACP methyl ester carboxylesterase